jgi:putative Holliday junction resolvase
VSDPRPTDTVLAFDFGLRRVGVAVGTRLTAGAEPIGVVRADDAARLFAAIAELIRTWQPARLVVGRPLHPDGSPHAMTAHAERFARRLHGRFGLPVEQVDERYSSAAAASEVAGREGGRSLDAEAAAIILRQYWAEQAQP